jgi:hypothetical protein
MKAPTGSKTTIRGDRVEWSEVKNRIDLGIVATALLGPVEKRQGRRLLWRCPWHDDHDPSFEVKIGEPWWNCRPCGLGGDAANLVMKLKGVGFPAAAHWLAELVGIVPPAGKPIRPRPPIASPAKAASRPPDPPSGLPPLDALALVEDAEQRLWTSEGSTALTYLHGRGLDDETIRRHRLGMVANLEIPRKDGSGTWRASGVVIPWFDGDRLTLLKIRRREGAAPKYVEVFRDRPLLYPDPAAVRPGRPMTACEGELDALLLRQELADLEVSVVSLGSASARPDAVILGRMLCAAPWFVATDADQAGDRSASGWPARAIRVRPPTPHKDWTEAAQSGVNLARWWRDRLGGIERPARSTWEELAAMRWGPAIGDPAPGIVINRPAQMPIAFIDDLEERAAIFEFEAGIPRAEAGRRAGLSRHDGSRRSDTKRLVSSCIDSCSAAIERST